MQMFWKIVLLEVLTLSMDLFLYDRDLEALSLQI